MIENPLVSSDYVLQDNLQEEFILLVLKEHKSLTEAAINLMQRLSSIG